jgi:hypothetical protein
MLIEYRRLAFPGEDLLEAIRQHDRATGERRLQGDLELIGISQAPEVTVQATGADDAAKHTTVLDQRYLLAAMLRYCISQRIPVAKKAEKHVELIDGNLALSLTIDQETTAAAGEEYFVLL